MLNQNGDPPSPTPKPFLREPSGGGEYLYRHTFSNFVDGYSFDRNGDIVSEKLDYTLKRIVGGSPVPHLGD